MMTKKGEIRMSEKRKYWTEKEDQTIIDTIALYHEAGEPYTQAFDELTKFLPNRTRDAIALRWNFLSKDHPELAKRTKQNRSGFVSNAIAIKSNKTQRPIKKQPDEVDLMEVDQIINFMNTVKSAVGENLQIQKENENLRERIRQLNEKLKEKEDAYIELENKYREIMLLMKAFQDVLSKGEKEEETTYSINGVKLKMEKNGNLVKVNT